MIAAARSGEQVDDVEAFEAAALAAVPSPVLRLVLREAFWPDTLAPLPAIDTATALAAVAFAVS